MDDWKCKLKTVGKDLLPLSLPREGKSLVCAGEEKCLQELQSVYNRNRQEHFESELDWNYEHGACEQIGAGC